MVIIPQVVTEALQEADLEPQADTPYLAERLVMQLLLVPRRTWSQLSSPGTICATNEDPWR